ncbi:hypothetical protein ABZ671_00555 [Micromonospora sp. NPDC006766]|uniref:hypothetical protein n=1 Tax=Micromonospora sp. NPDC006766 TaxID=3154778 RepID=UPI0034034CB4
MFQPDHATDRPLIDLDLGRAHQYGYPDRRFIPAGRGEGWPALPDTTTTRTPGQETRP